MSEIDERMQNWRTDRITEYARLENIVTTEMRKMGTDPDLDALMRDRVKLNEIIELGEGCYLKNIDAAQQQQAGIKLELVETWSDTEEKTFECDAGTATLRTTKSLNIRDKEKLVAFLELNKKLTNFIKSFEITKLRKIKDAGMIEDEIATWDIKRNVAISIKETTTEADQ